jgi:hypothetical protein
MFNPTPEFTALPVEEQRQELKNLVELLVGRMKTEARENPTAAGVIDAQRKMLDTLEDFGFEPPRSVRDVTQELYKYSGIFPQPNFAVEMCCDAYSDMLKKQTAAGMTSESAEKAAKMAYSTYMPKLSSRIEISDFIACVTHGMAIGILPGAEGTRLLYAAQVASSSLPSAKARKQQRKNPQNHIPVPVPTPAEATT